jgi:hypothetical protein
MHTPACLWAGNPTLLHGWLAHHNRFVKEAIPDTRPDLDKQETAPEAQGTSTEKAEIRSIF